MPLAGRSEGRQLYSQANLKRANRGKSLSGPFYRCATNADCRLADRRPADLQTCRLADLQTCGLADTFGTHGEWGGGGIIIIAPAGSIPRWHSSNSRVYQGKYLQL